MYSLENILYFLIGALNDIWSMLVLHLVEKETCTRMLTHTHRHKRKYEHMRFCFTFWWDRCLMKIKRKKEREMFRYLNNRRFVWIWFIQAHIEVCEMGMCVCVDRMPTPPLRLCLVERQSSKEKLSSPSYALRINVIEHCTRCV